VEKNPSSDAKGTEMKLPEATHSPGSRRGRWRWTRALLLLAATALGAACSSVIDEVPPSTRYGTAAALAQEAFPDGAETALLATGRDFADALAAAPLSAARSGPILLTEPTQVPEETMDALDELGVTEVVLLGGPSAISEDAEAQLSDASYEVSRRAGADRYETAASLAQLAHPDGADTVLLATGAHFADALASAPLAEAEDAPILLSGVDRLPDPTAEALQELGASQIIVLGGRAVIGESVEQQLAAAGYEVTRRAGTDRYDTAALLAESAFPDGADVAMLTTGQDFPDALAAAPLSAERDAPILLAEANRVPEATIDALETLGVEEVVLLGGTTAIGASVEDRLNEEGYEVNRLPD
jgi:putative cell wall-binding protein